MKAPTIGPFPLGVNNRKPDHDLTQTVGDRKVDLLRSAVNVDLDASGKPRRRAGFSLAIGGGVAHSAWGDDRAAFYVDDNTLFWLELQGDQLVRKLVRGNLTPGAQVSYCEAGGIYFYTNGSVLGMAANGVALDFTPEPAGEPELVAIDGTLPAGQYQFCFTYFGPAGESAATWPVAITLTSQGGIELRHLPVAPEGLRLVAYMTGTDGEVFGRVDLQVQGTTATVRTLQVQEGRCKTLELEPMPAGQIVRSHNARLLVTNGNVLHYSEPYHLGLHRPSKNFIPFPAPITVVEPCGSGVYVVADKTYWLQGEITQASLAVVLPYGAVPHSGGNDPVERETVFWLSERGLVFGGADGSVRNVQEAQLALAGGAAGATVYREKEGVAHVLTAVREPTQSQAAIGCFFDAEIIRKGTML